MEKEVFRAFCWYFILQEWDICETKLSLLLYYSQGYNLVFADEPLFSFPIYAGNYCPEFRGEALEVIRDTVYTRDYINFYLRLAYYFQGYLDYFKEK